MAHPASAVSTVSAVGTVGTVGTVGAAGPVNAVSAVGVVSAVGAVNTASAVYAVNAVGADTHKRNTARLILPCLLVPLRLRLTASILELNISLALAYHDGGSDLLLMPTQSGWGHHAKNHLAFYM